GLDRDRRVERCPSREAREAFLSNLNLDERHRIDRLRVDELAELERRERVAVLRRHMRVAPRVARRDEISGRRINEREVDRATAAAAYAARRTNRRAVSAHRFATTRRDVRARASNDRAARRMAIFVAHGTIPAPTRGLRAD